MSRKERKLSQKILRHSTDGCEPDLAPLLESTPSMLQRAQRARNAARIQSEDVWELLPAMIGRALPALAVLAVVMIVFVGWDLRNDAGGADETGSQAVHVETLLLTGEMTNEAVDEDLLLGLLLAEEEGDG